MVVVSLCYCVHRAIVFFCFLCIVLEKEMMALFLLTHICTCLCFLIGLCDDNKHCSAYLCCCHVSWLTLFGDVFFCLLHTCYFWLSVEFLLSLFWFVHSAFLPLFCLIAILCHSFSVELFLCAFWSQGKLQHTHCIGTMITSSWTASWHWHCLVDVSELASFVMGARSQLNAFSAHTPAPTCPCILAHMHSHRNARACMRTPFSLNKIPHPHPHPQKKQQQKNTQTKPL